MFEGTVCHSCRNLSAVVESYVSLVVSEAVSDGSCLCVYNGSTFHMVTCLCSSNQLKWLCFCHVCCFILLSNCSVINCLHQCCSSFVFIAELVRHSGRFVQVTTLACIE